MFAGSSAVVEVHVVIKASQNQVFSDLGGEAIILNLQSGVYYGLNEIGAQIWTLIQQPKTLKEIQTKILDTYDVEPDVCLQDLKDVLQDMEAAGLIEVGHASAA